MRQFFTTKKLADSYAQKKNTELVTHGSESVNFPTALRVMARDAEAVLAPYGKNIADAISFYLPHLKAMNKTCSVKELSEEIARTKRADGAKERYLSDISSRLGQFADAFNGTSVATITATAIDEWLRSLKVGPVTRNNFRRVLIVAFNFAIARGYCTTNPASETAEAKETKLAAGILTVQQSADLLSHCDPKILPAVALGLFAGIRPESEGLHLDWSHIDFEDKTIDVQPDKTKVDSSARYVDMLDNLTAWLLPHRQKKGPVFPSLTDYYTLLREARKAAGIKQWPHDALRHSFGSYHYGAHRSAAITQAQMGHTSPQIFFKHYRKPIKQAAAQPFWNILPLTDARGAIVAFSHS